MVLVRERGQEALDSFLSVLQEKLKIGDLCSPVKPVVLPTPRASSVDMWQQHLKGKEMFLKCGEEHRIE